MDGSNGSLPYSEDAEKGVLCSLVLSPREVTKLCAERLQPDAFYAPAHRIIYELVIEFSDQSEPIDFIRLKQTLKDRGYLEEVGGPEFLNDLYNFVPTPANASYYIDIVREKHSLRRTILVCRNAERRCLDPGAESKQLLLEIRQEILDATNTDSPLNECELKAKGDEFYLKGDTGFPQPMRPEAFHGLAGDIVRIIEPESEACPEAILLQLLVALGSIVGHLPYRTQGSRHHLNEFVVLVGETSRGRKGTSWRAIENLLQCVDSDWLQDRVINGIQSGEAIIYYVRDLRFGRRQRKQKAPTDGESETDEIIDSGVADKRLLLLEEEFARILEVSGRNGSTISPVLRDAWEGRTRLCNAGKHSPDKATEAHISLIGHITKVELQRCLRAIEHQNGFANRVLWVASRRTKKISIPKWIEWNNEKPEIIERLTNIIATFHRDSSAQRRMEFSQQGLKAWKQFYDSIDDSQLGSIGAILGRAEAHVLRLAMIYTVLDDSVLIEPKHIAAAKAVWDYCRSSAYWAFQNSSGNTIADKILWALQREPGGLSRDQIRNEVLWRHCSKTQLDQALSVLKQNGLADQKYQPTKGRPTEVWFAINGSNCEKIIPH